MAAPASTLTAEFESAYRIHFEFVWRALGRQGVPVAVLDDAVQEVFMVAHRRWGAWEGRTSFRAWLYGVARRVASTHRRTQRRHRAKLHAMPAPPPALDLDERLDESERIDRLAHAIAALPSARRDVFVLADMEGLSAPEIADALGCKLNTVYSRLRRARQAVVQAMARPDRNDDAVHEPHGSEQVQP